MVAALAVIPWADAARAAPEAVLVPVRLPITGTRDTQVTAAILRQLDVLRRAAPERGVLVLEFTGGGEGDPAASDFGRALELARFLTDARLTGVKTVAFLPQGVSGHAVLPVLACEEIVMPADAVLGPAHRERARRLWRDRGPPAHRAAGGGREPRRSGDPRGPRRDGRG